MLRFKQHRNWYFSPPSVTPSSIHLHLFHLHPRPLDPWNPIFCLTKGGRASQTHAHGRDLLVLRHRDHGPEQGVRPGPGIRSHPHRLRSQRTRPIHGDDPPAPGRDPVASGHPRQPPPAGDRPGPLRGRVPAGDPRSAEPAADDQHRLQLHRVRRRVPALLVPPQSAAALHPPVCQRLPPDGPAARHHHVLALPARAATVAGVKRQGLPEARGPRGRQRPFHRPVP